MTREPRARVHIVDDDELVRARTSYMLANHGYSAEIYTGGVEFFREGGLKRGCILLDLRMPRMSGFEVLEELARLGSTLPVVVMSAYGDVADAVRAMKLGAVDFIEKPLAEEDLLGAVSRALALSGTSGACRNARTAAAARLNRLSPRQRDILQGLLDGLSNKGIARRLGLSPRTVEMHRARMKSELGVASLSEAVQFAIAAALVWPVYCTVAPTPTHNLEAGILVSTESLGLPNSFAASSPRRHVNNLPSEM